MPKAQEEAMLSKSLCSGLERGDRNLGLPVA
jgi:hypothetical protein